MNPPPLAFLHDLVDAYPQRHRECVYHFIALDLPEASPKSSDLYGCDALERHPFP